LVLFASIIITIIIAGNIIFISAFFAFLNNVHLQMAQEQLGIRTTDLLIKMNPLVDRTETLQNGQKATVKFKLL
jgi:hypothetical protein